MNKSHSRLGCPAFLRFCSAFNIPFKHAMIFDTFGDRFLYCHFGIFIVTVILLKCYIFVTCLFFIAY